MICQNSIRKTCEFIIHLKPVENGHDSLLFSWKKIINQRIDFTKGLNMQKDMKFQKINQRIDGNYFLQKGLNMQKDRYEISLISVKILLSNVHYIHFCSDNHQVNSWTKIITNEKSRRCVHFGQMTRPFAFHFRLLTVEQRLASPKTLGHTELKNHA